MPLALSCCGDNSPVQTEPLVQKNDSQALDTQSLRSELPETQTHDTHLVRTTFIDSSGLKQFEQQIDSVMKIALNDKKFDFEFHKSTFSLDSTWEEFLPGYKYSVKYQFKTKPPYSHYAIKFDEHIYENSKAPDSVMNRLYTLCILEDFGVSKSPEYYLRTGNIIYNLSMSCGYAGKRYPQIKGWFDEIIFLSGNDIDTLVGDCGGGCWGIETKTVYSLSEFKGNYRWKLHCVLDSSSWEWGRVDSQRINTFLSKEWHIEETTMTIGSEVHNLKRMVKTTLPTTYKYFIRDERNVENLKMHIPADLLSMKGQVVHNTIFYGDFSQSLFIQFPNGKVGTISHGCLFYLEPI